MTTEIPSDPQAVLNAVVQARAIPWRPADDPELANLSWVQLVRENVVPATNCGLIGELETLLRHPHPLEVLRLYAGRLNLEFPECTP